MKTKRIKEKLVFQKETIVDLNKLQMTEVKGGWIWTERTCTQYVGCVCASGGPTCPGDNC